MTFNVFWQFSQPIVVSSLVSEFSFMSQCLIQITNVTLLKIALID